MLTFLAVLALGAVICLPGMAAAGSIFLDFDLPPGTNLNEAGGDYSYFAWEGWTVETGGFVSANSNATISLTNTVGTFGFEGADFSLMGASYLKINNVEWNFPKPDLMVFTAFTGITKLTFTSDGMFAMDNFKDSVVIPLPGALVLLGAGLVRLAAYSRRKRAMA
jgi:hypothetical protein